MNIKNLLFILSITITFNNILIAYQKNEKEKPKKEEIDMYFNVKIEIYIVSKKYEPNKIIEKLVQLKKGNTIGNLKQLIKKYVPNSSEIKVFNNIIPDDPELPDKTIIDGKLIYAGVTYGKKPIENSYTALIPGINCLGVYCIINQKTIDNFYKLKKLRGFQ